MARHTPDHGGGNVLGSTTVRTTTNPMTLPLQQPPEIIQPKPRKGTPERK